MKALMVETLLAFWSVMKPRSSVSVELALPSPFLCAA